MTFIISLFCTILITFSHLGNTDIKVSRRLLSVANEMDLSWRNRVAAWEGALAIMGDNPFLGTGWSLAYRIYEHSYRMPRLVRGTAFDLNDYFALGAKIGILPMCCLACGLWSILKCPRKICVTCVMPQLLGNNVDRCASKSAALVLAVGFFFDGGLFFPETALVFWSLLGICVQSSSNAYGEA
jgi:O-antigen ligase